MASRPGDISTALWTTQRVADLIERRFGVRYHRDHVGRVLGQMGWSCPRPVGRAKERNEAALEAGGVATD